MADRASESSREKYHHGDLRRTLVAAAAEIIATAGVDALTLRGVGDRVGVSRTALYRHFADKAALLAAVALEGFQRLHRALDDAGAAARVGGSEPLLALGAAYVAFGLEHPAHYRTMFGGSLTDKERYPDLATEGQATFAVLVGAIVAGQAAGRFRPGDPVRIAQVVWSTVHGIVLLTSDQRLGHLPPEPPGGPSLAALAGSILLAGLVDDDPPAARQPARED